MQHLKTLLWKQVTDFTLKVKSSFSLSCLKLLQLYYCLFFNENKCRTKYKFKLLCMLRFLLHRYLHRLGGKYNLTIMI